MAILLKRARLRLLWLVTGHPRFRPLYFADVVSFDPLEQALFLCQAGYFVAATMIARHALESRVKRLAMVAPEWRTFTASKDRSRYHELAAFLGKHHHVSRVLRNRMIALFDKASRVVHGDELDSLRCAETVREIQNTVEWLDQVAIRLLKATTEEKGGQLCPGR